MLVQDSEIRWNGVSKKERMHFIYFTKESETLAIQIDYKSHPSLEVRGEFKSMD